jgi:hypothetical protein
MDEKEWTKTEDREYEERLALGLAGYTEEGETE